MLGHRWLDRGADLIAYGRAYLANGRAYLANPDLVERFRTGALVRVANPDTYYSGGDTGYIDYAAHVPLRTAG